MGLENEAEIASLKSEQNLHLSGTECYKGNTSVQTEKFCFAAGQKKKTENASLLRTTNIIRRRCGVSVVFAPSEESIFLLM